MKILCILLAATLGAAAAPSDPGKAAVDFLEKVRRKKLNLEPGGDTALSPQTREVKKRQIAKRLERMAGDLGSDPLEIGPVKLDEDFAGVIIRKVGGFDPGRLQVFAVAMVRRGADWIAAPVPASFENSGAGYGQPLRSRLETLETWMLREQVKDLEELREQSKEQMRRKIEASLTASELRGADARHAADLFLTACAKSDLPSVLGLLGGLAEKLPDDWPARLKAADRALAGGITDGPWRLLRAPEVTRVIAAHGGDKGRGDVSLLCLDPGMGDTTSPRIRSVNLDLTKSPDGLWRINLPAEFLREPDSHQDSSDNDEGGFDSDLTDSFAIDWSAAHPPTYYPDAAAARDAWLLAVRAKSPEGLLAMSKLRGPSGYATRAALQVARAWRSVGDPSNARQALPLSFQADESAAVALIQFFSPRDPDRWDGRPVYFEKSATGWYWNPEPTTAVSGKFEPWLGTESRLWPDKWQQELLRDCPKITSFDNLQAPPEQAARDCVGKWLAAIATGNVAVALQYTAFLGEENSGATALKNIGYEIGESRRQKGRPEITSVYVGKIFAGVAAAVPGAEKANVPVYAVALTEKGPRVLAEIDLFAGGNRNRAFLNKAAMAPLRKAPSPAVAEDLQEIFNRHAAAVEKAAVPKTGP